MTSIIAHHVLQALIMLATSKECPPPDWYPEGTTHDVQIDSCRVLLGEDMTAKDAKAFYRTARKLAGHG